MYKAKLWDEDKWDIHSASYSSSKYGIAFQDDKKDDKKYHEQKYGSKEKNIFSDYARKDDSMEKEGKENSSLFDEMVEEKKEQKTEDEIQFKAANQIFSGRNPKPKKIKQKKELETIEDAIKKAIEEEKNIIIIDN